MIVIDAKMVQIALWCFNAWCGIFLFGLATANFTIAKKANFLSLGIASLWLLYCIVLLFHALLVR